MQPNDHNDIDSETSANVTEGFHSLQAKQYSKETQLTSSQNIRKNGILSAAQSAFTNQENEGVDIVIASANVPELAVLKTADVGKSSHIMTNTEVPIQKPDTEKAQNEKHTQSEGRIDVLTAPTTTITLGDIPSTIVKQDALTQMPMRLTSALNTASDRTKKVSLLKFYEKLIFFYVARNAL